MSLGDKNSLHNAISSFQEFVAARLHITYIVVAPFSVRSVTESHDLPEQNTKTPHVTSRAERSMFKRLGCGPTNWNFTSLWGNQKKHDLMLRCEIRYLLRSVREKQLITDESKKQLLFGFQKGLYKSIPQKGSLKVITLDRIRHYTVS